ncbi:MAG: TolC family protein, partial [Candidatus Aminicenantes bacterium]|nr:TolC family protein [Candidatus Aminicenantes bacterium]
MRKTTVLCLLAILAAAALAAAQEKKEVSLTLEESIVKALKNNLNLAVEVYSPRIAEASLSRAREMFLPQFNMNYGRNRTEQPSTWWLQGSETLTSTLNDYTVSLTEQVPLGGNFSMSLAGYKSTNNQRFQLINPTYSSTLRFNFTQPLLRGFGYDISRQQILVASNNLAASENQFQAALVDTVYLVEEAYWNYVYAIENLKVKQQSLALGRDLLVKTRKEVEVGAQAPIEVLNAEATVAQREADILVAESLVKKSEETLRAVINLGAE